jgi:oligopeptide transport system ATP-binding protein
VPLLSVHELRTYFHTRSGVYRAVDGVSFSVERGETLGIVGESGSGKSVTCYSIMGLVPQPPGRIEGGTALFDGTDLLRCTPAQARAIRGKRVSMIFQDPMTSLNPYLRISDQLIEPLLIHERISRSSALQRGLEALEMVGINDAAKRMHLYPHEFSGGMRQRVMIAMALITKPESADRGRTHHGARRHSAGADPRADQETAARAGDGGDLHHARFGRRFRALRPRSGDVRRPDRRARRHPRPFRFPRHPYTRALQRSIPSLQPKGSELYTITGMPPDVSKPISGCAFADRCEFAALLPRKPPGPRNRGPPARARLPPCPAR